MAGAMLVASLSFWVLTRFALAPVALLDMIAIAAVLAVVAQMADLFESALKRKNDIKDSGAIIPGHGGILDRVDGLVGVFIALHIVALWRGGPVADALWVW
jgi:phosphatidate cytidylyltransferase